MSEKLYLIRREVEDVFGVGRRTLEKLVSERKVRRVKVGRAYRYSRAELENVMSGGALKRHMRPGRTATA